MKSKFIFYFPYHGFGGVPVLFLRVAEKLIELGHSVCVIDYYDGYMAQNKSDSISFIQYFSTEKKIQIPEKSILILQSDLPWGIPQNFICCPETKIFFWNCYPFNLVPVLPRPLGDYFASQLFWLKILLNTVLLTARSKTKKMVRALIQKKAIGFMDFPNWNLTQWALQIPELPKKYLPILVSANKIFEAQSIFDKNLIQIAWLGRIADFKIHSLLRLIKDLNLLSASYSYRFKLTVIGTGDHDESLIQALKNAPEIKYEMIQSISQIELHHFLNSHIDLLFAMGTSALEGGLAQIPTILMNFSYSKISKKYKYQFLFEAQEYSLGDLVSPLNISNGLTLCAVIEKTLLHKKNLAQKSAQYVIQNHSLENKIQLFVDACEKSQMTYNELVTQYNLSKPGYYLIWTFIKKFL